MRYKSKVIKLKDTLDISALVANAELVEGDVIIKSGNRYIDASSLLGMVGIASREAIVIFYPENAKNFDNFIKQYII